jgi:phage terminase large subunit-like protein
MTLTEFLSSHNLTWADIAARRDEVAAWIQALPREDQVQIAQDFIAYRRAATNQQQLELYQPASDRARAIHLSTAKHVLAVGGNRSGKTETGLVDLVICMTGIVPWSLEHDYPREKIQCPMRVRIVLESLSNTWAPVIRPKLQWDKWSGEGEPGSGLGHWGWIPRRFLKRGKWEESWLEKERTLNLTCGCSVQIMSYDQDVQDFSGSSLHRVLFDEAPPADIYRENLMRTLDTKGKLYFGFTPPDDPGKAMRGSWVYELYEKGIAGPAKDSNIDSFNLFTEENRILDQSEIAEMVKGLTPAQRETRLHGVFMHLSGRIYPQYTDAPTWWCFTCNEKTFLNGDSCATCGASQLIQYSNVCEPNELAYRWPVVFLLDPHPRKPNCMMWVAIDPSDDWWVINEMEVDGDPELVRDRVLQFERNSNLVIAARLMDPNMAEQAAHSAGTRHVSVRDEFDAVGIRCALADDAFTVGMKRVRDMIKPDLRTKRPRLQVFATCPRTNQQMKKYVWQEWSRNMDDQKDPKAVAIAKEDDFPGLLRYLANAQPTFRGLQLGGQPMRLTKRPRHGAYGNKPYPQMYS